MKKKICYSLALLVIILVILIDPLKKFKVYAKLEKNKFFEIEKKQVTPNEEIEMTINLDLIEFSNFRFELKSNDDVTLTDIDEESSEVIETLEQDENIFAFDFEKENSNLSRVILKYQLPTDAEIGDVLNFEASVTSLENEGEEVKEIINVTIVDESENEFSNEIDNEDKIKEEKQSNNKVKEDNRKTNEETASSSHKNVMTNTKKTSVSPSGNSKETTVKYKGSDNNYLCALEVEGYVLNESFRKDGSTYFINVGNDVSAVNVSATPEISTDKVTITGQNNLKSGTNKILVAVSAENGDVRNYRIFVIKEG